MSQEQTATLKASIQVLQASVEEARAEVTALAADKLQLQAKLAETQQQVCMHTCISKHAKFTKQLLLLDAAYMGCQQE